MRNITLITTYRKR